MATIAICVSPMAGELNGTLKLARTWARAGHRIVYVGVADGRDVVERHGFDYEVFLEQQLPLGSVEDERFYSRMERTTGFTRLVAANRRKRRIERVLTGLLHHRHNDVEATFLRLRPDLVVIGTHCRYPTLFGLIAARLRIRCVYLTQQMIQAGRAAAEDPREARPARLWSTVVAGYRRALFDAANIDYPKYFRAFLDAADLPVGSANHASQRFPLRAPILYPWPSPFDLPGLTYTNVMPIEAGIELERREDPAILAGLPRRSGLVYCSFGMLLPLGVDATRALLHTVVETMRRIEDVQFVLALGPFFEESEFRDVPPNVLLCRRAPQMALLDRADGVITHGGSSTVRECLMCGVPMIVIPFGFESGEYARRVAFHGIGLAVDRRTVSVPQLTGLVRLLREDRRYRAAAARMRAALEAWEREAPSLRAIDMVLAAPPGAVIPAPVPQQAALTSSREDA